MEIASDTALKQLLTATPPKITVVLDAPIFWAVSATSNTAATAPPKAAPAIIQPENTPKAQHSVTASPAPALTPMIPGDANLFVNTLCITAPDTDSAAPDSTQATVLGTLAYQTILAAGVSTFPIPFFITAKSSVSVIFALPRQILKTIAAIKSNAAPAKQLFVLYFFI
jgi:hypothetical protein